MWGFGLGSVGPIPGRLFVLLCGLLVSQFVSLIDSGIAMGLFVLTVVVALLFVAVPGDGRSSHLVARAGRWIALVLSIGAGLVALNSFVAGVTRGDVGASFAKRVSGSSVRCVDEPPRLEDSTISMRVCGVNMGQFRNEPGIFRPNVTPGVQRVDAVVVLDDPTLQQSMVVAAINGAMWGGLSLILYLLFRLLASVDGGSPFQAANIGRVRLIAAAVLVVWPIADLLQALSMRRFIRDLRVQEAVAMGVSLLPLFFAALLLALAEVWRRGVSLQRESEATV